MRVERAVDEHLIRLLTGIKVQWITEAEKLLTTQIEQVEVEVKNVLDRGEYYARPVDAIGVIVHSNNEPVAVAAWYGDDHVDDWNVYGDQPEHSQQTYYLGGARTIFVGLF
ncbi:hypothetical protein CANMA_005319 [Candida margitis]|uniref:uncharacterized protein n=1 Tax=Candida margitis TaxID=1775924 RepID=UPI0022267470|nr:uncharacterized protein CANMA_005319 [Candida margitis]KAI5950391.1 hypothetical protein CANMA_005319 [Candida margitis]